MTLGVVIAELLYGCDRDTVISAPWRDGEKPKGRANGDTGKPELVERGQLTKTASKILHSAGCFEAV
jgi:hypothetical protein